MDSKDKVVAVTGGAHGIGAALCRRFAQEGARTVIVLDLDIAAAGQVANECAGHAYELNVADEQAVADTLKEIQATHGLIDLYCSNAGVAEMDGPDFLVSSCSNQGWEASWQVNVMAHVYACRALLPGMIERGSGYFLITASAAGLLSQIASAPYSTTKHAAVGFSESLFITHADDGIGVSVLCPQGVRTRMIAGMDDGGVTGVDGVIEPEALAECVVQGLADEKFLILPHPEVLTYMQRKTADYDRWLHGMRKLRQRFTEA